MARFGILQAFCLAAIVVALASGEYLVMSDCNDAKSSTVSTHWSYKTHACLNYHTGHSDMYFCENGRAKLRRWLGKSDCSGAPTTAWSYKTNVCLGPRMMYCVDQLPKGVARVNYHTSSDCSDEPFYVDVMSSLCTRGNDKSSGSVVCQDPIMAITVFSNTDSCDPREATDVETHSLTTNECVADVDPNNDDIFDFETDAWSNDQDDWDGDYVVDDDATKARRRSLAPVPPLERAGLLPMTHERRDVNNYISITCTSGTASPLSHWATSFLLALFVAVIRHF
ncbi:uncharacterized protein MONBRDRAFT_34425 [Monosiga brevicollis MX1]|uniref:Uncharacterized protein n=1 Tax=Monosiga brevicollis TaxID=81824 RepID=A9VBP4_MONBE|nr:uncharacterized protein MONBRDRAFT_34425 [Monosiga brevicollis MX1]EDQ84967.1 predicted protein [Monosiga brevicollis MX1]|eukprot:XP_001750137.1 hypothetical protein [Monosiga brevicollis MX1]